MTAAIASSSPLGDIPSIQERLKLWNDFQRESKINLSLQIRESKFPDAGMGVFALKRIDRCDEILRIDPTANASMNILREHVCDTCFYYKPSKLLGSKFESATAERNVLCCSKCNVARYCSKICQKRAWTTYHKHECEALSGEAKMRSDGSLRGPLSHTTRLLFRILVLRKHRLLSDLQWKALNSLESHVSDHMQSSFGDFIVKAAKMGQRLTGTDIDFTAIQHLVCTLMTNSVALVAVETPTLGSSFDIFVSLFNHSCTPNAHVFSVGNELRVRALRTISKDEEITIPYTAIKADVVTRRADLKAQWFFHCKCSRCIVEEKEYPAMLAALSTSVERVALAQPKLSMLLTELLLKPQSQRSHQALRNFEHRLCERFRTVFPHSTWPFYITPCMDIMKELGDAYLSITKLERGLHFVVPGCLPLKDDIRIGPEWVHGLHELASQVQMVVSSLDTLAQAAKKKRMMLEFSYPLPELRVFLYKALYTLMVETELVYGRDTVFSEGIRKWHLDAKAEPGRPQISDDICLATFDEEWKKLFMWAVSTDGKNHDFGVTLVKEDTGETASFEEMMVALNAVRVS